MFYKIYKDFFCFLLVIVLIIKEQEAAYNAEAPAIVRERWRETVFLPQRSSSTLNVNFSPTALPSYGKNSPRGRALSVGDQNLVEVCSARTRKPCGPTDRIKCLRWSCCWNDEDDIKCTKPRYIFVGAKQCGVINNNKIQGFQQVVDNPILTLLSRLFQPRIVGGQQPVEGSFPWIARLIVRSNSQTFCGGSLINKRWVVTAAHCFPTADASFYSVVLGDHIISDTTGNEQFFDMSQLIYHPDYNQVTQANDIAMIKLSRDAVYTKYVSPVCLAPPEFLTDDDKPGSLAGNTGVVSGWGRNGPTGSPTDTLMYVLLPIIPNSVCSAIVTDAPGKFCAGGVAGFDSCQGDSGGPLVLADAKDGRVYLHGIVSTAIPGTTCGTTAFGLYVRVRDYYTWIKGVMDT